MQEEEEGEEGREGGREGGREEVEDSSSSRVLGLHLLMTRLCMLWGVRPRWSR